MSLHAVEHRKRLAETYPWTSAPLIVGAPMRVMSGPELAVAIVRAGGLGFIGPGLKPESTAADLEAVKSLLKETPLGASTGQLLPVGVGFQAWNGDLEEAARAVAAYKPSAAWLFAPRDGQPELDKWTDRLREASPDTQIWIQVGSFGEALDAAKSSSRPDALVIQGAEAGGHGRANDGVGFVTLLPEVADAVRSAGISLPIFAAGGIADGRGVAAALGLGAAGAVMGTRFLASKEARIAPGYQNEVIRAADGASSTTRTQLYNHLRGTFGWPEAFSPRTIINKSWEEHQAGASFDEVKKRHDELLKQGDAAWGPEGRTATYAGANIGLIRSVDDAGTIVEQARRDAIDIIRSLNEFSSAPGRKE
ncbi:inosine monophosphate dehydrogenase [Thozetella sp. PMI_491]|nr:inosine monophosphate dehydrogenase [Thozetella sp. PMI_491]